MMYRLLTVLLACAINLLLASPGLFAHESGITDTQIKIGHSKVKLTYTAPIEHLNQAFDNPSSAVPAGWNLKNNDRRCQVEKIFKKNLDKIHSKQFVIIYDCLSKLGQLSIQDSNMFAAIEGHTNYARVLMAGRTLNLRFTQAFQIHSVPISQMLSLWGKELSDAPISLANVSGSGELASNIPDELRSTTWLDLIRQGRGYFPIGVEHIVFGYDHLLFLLGLLLLPLSLKHVLYLITSFSIAHSITLALSVLDIVTLPAWLVESAIAASIIYIAFDNITELRKFRSNANYATPWKRRLGITFGFGLVHGFGFSFILREIGFGDEALSPLFFFNLGVETGQLVVIACLYPVINFLFSLGNQFTFSRLCSFVMALLGSYWLIARVGLE